MGGFMYSFVVMCSTYSHGYGLFMYNIAVFYVFNTKLEQLECMHSEIPPPPHDYPY